VVVSGTIDDSRASDHRDNLEATPLPRAVFATTDVDMPGSRNLTAVGGAGQHAIEVDHRGFTAAGWTSIGALSQLETRCSAAFFGD
jgi:hypothetical protein